MAASLWKNNCLTYLDLERFDRDDIDLLIPDLQLCNYDTLMIRNCTDPSLGIELGLQAVRH